jgi:hypothetical protein
VHVRSHFGSYEQTVRPYGGVSVLAAQGRQRGGEHGGGAGGGGGVKLAPCRHRPRVWPRKQCLPRHHPYFRLAFLELIGIP